MSGWLDPDLAKLGIAGGLAAGTMIFASIPVLLSRRASSEHSGVKHMLSGLSCLGGGVFLATCFLHLIPEAIEKMDAALKSSKVETKDFPVAYAIVIAGFLLVLISDQFVQRFNKDHINLGHSHGPVRTNAGPVPVPNYGAIHRNAALHSSPGSDELGEIDHPVEDTVEDSDEEDRMTTVSMHGDPGSHKPFRVIVLVFALSLHSFFEGLAVGLQKSTQDVFQLFGAIMVHKSVIAITISTNLVSTTRLKTCGIFTAIGVFSAMAPIGILFALLLDDAPALVVGVLQCIAAGTFVYITFFEILPHELNSASTERSRLFKTLALLAGILIVIGLMYALPEDHDDHHHDCPTTTTTMAPNISTTTVS